MNSQPESQTPDQIRSDIETTRQRMDNTMDAIGDRLHGRHLLDEVIGFFRSSSSSSSSASSNENAGEGESENTAERLKEKASSALSAVADTIKENPLPALVIGAGVAWLIYESRRDKTPDFRSDASWSEESDDDFNAPLNYPTPGEEDFEPSGADEDDFRVEGNESISRERQPESGLESAESAVREKAYEGRDIVREKLARARESVREGAQHVRERASEIGSRVQQRSKEIYVRSRDQIVRTANEQPLAVGLGVLALGVAVGLALPTPQGVNRIAGPTADRLRQKARDTGRDYVQRGKRVARAAADAAKSEAQKQGLTVEALRGKTAGDASQHRQDSQQNQPTGQSPNQPVGQPVAQGASCEVNPQSPGSAASQSTPGNPGGGTARTA